MEGFPYYRVKLDDAVAQCELEELLELAAEGRIHGETLIIPPFSSAWQAANTLSELAGQLSLPTSNEDLWDAWESMDDSAGESEEAWTAGDATELAMAPVQRAAATDEPTLLTDENIQPLEPDHKATRTEALNPPLQKHGSPLPEHGKIIAFPQERTHPNTDGAYALAPDTFPRLTLPPPKPVQTSTLEVLSYTVRWQRLIPIVGVGLMGIAVVWFWFYEQANATFPPHPDTVQTVRPDTLPADVEVQFEPQQIQDNYDRLEQDIRQRTSMNVALIRSAEELEDTMYVELHQAGLDLVSAQTEVLRWGGPQQDVPKSTNFRIRIRSREGQLDRELGTVALIVGKYIDRYDMEVPQFEVILESPQQEPIRWRLDAETARYLFEQRLSLWQFLNNLR